MTDLATADLTSGGTAAPEGDESMANARGNHFATDHSARGRAQSVLVAVIALLAVGALGFGLGRATAPDEKTTAATVGKTTGTSAPSANDDLLAQGLAQHKAGNLEGAAKLYNQILTTDAKNKFALFNLGVIAQTNKNYDEAIAKYKAAIADDPAFYSPTYNLGLTYAAKGDRANGIVHLRKAVEIDPKAAQAYFNLGTLLIQDGKTDEGTKLLNQAFAIDPSLKPK